MLYRGLVERTTLTIVSLVKGDQNYCCIGWIWVNTKGLRCAARVCAVLLDGRLFEVRDRVEDRLEIV